MKALCVPFTSASGRNEVEANFPNALFVEWSVSGLFVPLSRLLCFSLSLGLVEVHVKYSELLEKESQSQGKPVEVAKVVGSGRAFPCLCLYVIQCDYCFTRAEESDDKLVVEDRYRFPESVPLIGGIRLMSAPK